MTSVFRAFTSSGIFRGVLFCVLPRTVVTSRLVQLSTTVGPVGGGADDHSVGRIWENYKRNHKGAIPPKKTRIRCRRGPERIVNNACPICSRDIVIEYTDTKLLEQFISPYTGQILEATRTGLCRQQQKKMAAAIEKARDHGILPFPIPQKMPEEGFRTPSWNKVDIT